MDNQQPIKYQPNEDPAPAQPPRRSARRWGFLLILLPLLVCLGWAAVGMYAFRIMRPNIPITGGSGREPVLATEAPSGPTGTPGSPTQPSRPAPKANPAQPNTYSDDAGNQLTACSSSFRDFYVMEQLASREPTMFNSNRWRTDAKKAQAAFKSDCEPLGRLSTPPASLAEVDHWLKMAAGEVGPATQSFSAAMDRPDVITLDTVESHLKKFVEYIHNAETILDGMQQKKVI